MALKMYDEYMKGTHINNKNPNRNSPFYGWSLSIIKSWNHVGKFYDNLVWNEIVINTTFPEFKLLIYPFMGFVFGKS